MGCFWAPGGVSDVAKERFTKVSKSTTLSKMTLDSHAIHGTIVYIYLLPIYIYQLLFFE